MSMIPKNILAAGCAAYHNALMTGAATFGEGVEAAYFAIHDHDDWVSAGPPEWTGEGLPPVGTVCDLKFEHWTDWERHEILCHGKAFIFVRELNSGLDREGSMALDGIKFRPIRTPEQIAAEERIEEINEMAELSLYGHYAITLAQAKIACAVLHDKGYRKVTP